MTGVGRAARVCRCTAVLGAARRDYWRSAAVRSPGQINLLIYKILEQINLIASGVARRLPIAAAASQLAVLAAVALLLPRLAPSALPKSATAPLRLGSMLASAVGGPGNLGVQERAGWQWPSGCEARMGVKQLTQND